MTVKRIARIAAVLVIAVFHSLLDDAPGKAHAVDASMGGIDIVYGKTGGNAILDFVAIDQLINIPGVEEYLSEKLTITQDFDPAQKREIELALEYWAERVADTKPAANALIHVGYSKNPNGSAFSMSPSNLLGDPALKSGISPNGTVYDKFVLGKTSPYPTGLADNIIIFNLDFIAPPPRLLLPAHGDMATMLHEMGHAMGIMGFHTVLNPNDKGIGTEAIFTADQFTVWNSHLYDVFGKQSSPDMPISMNVTNNSSANQANVFQLYAQNGNAAHYKYPTFHGANVDALTGGAGMPVMGGFANNGPALDGANSLGHPGVMNSIMSYGIIGNMSFTEMELAAFQDMGYTMDRSKFFGKSFYHNVGGAVQTNTAGFNSSSVLGVGAHVMRNGLTLTQAADINASGFGAGGIRIDGVGNTVIIPKNIVVAANGDSGTGLLVSYGRGNVVSLDGRLEATGENGIGAHFGIKAGNPNVHSYMSYTPPASKPIQTKYEFIVANADMNGALVDRFDIAGSLAGSQAAIQIEPDSHVKAINVLDGGSVVGDIKSLWGRRLNRTGTEYATTITFGKAGSSGVTRLSGDIVWKEDKHAVGTGNSLDVVVAGGQFVFDGNANVQTWKVGADATFKPAVHGTRMTGIEVEGGAFDVAAGAKLAVRGISALSAGNHVYSDAVVTSAAAAPLPGSFSLSNDLLAWGGYRESGAAAYDFSLQGLKDMAPVLGLDPFYDQLRLLDAIPDADRDLFDDVYNTGRMSDRLAGYYNDMVPLVRANTQVAAANQLSKGFLGSAFDKIWRNPLRQAQVDFLTSSDEALASPCYESVERGLTAWFQASQGSMQRSSSATVAGYSYHPTDFAVGMDVARGSWFLGGAFQYGFGKVKTDATADGRRHENKVDSYLGALYAGYATPEFHIRGGVAYAMTRQDTQTRYGAADVASASYWSRSLGVDLEFGRRFEVRPGFALTPHLGATYSRIHTPGYRESGSGYARSFNASDWNVFELPVGVRLDKSLGDKLSLGLDAAYVPNLGKKSAETRVAFVAAPKGNAWTTIDPSASRHSFAGNATLNWRPSKHVAISLNYNLRLSRHSHTHTGTLATTLSF